MPLFLIFPLIRFCYDMLCTLILTHISGSLLISLSLVVNRTIMALELGRLIMGLLMITLSIMWP